MWSLQSDSSPAAPTARREPREHLPKEFVKRAEFTSWLIPPASPRETSFRHSAWQAKRTKVRDTLVSVGTNDFALNRFDECGSACTVEWSASEQRYRLRANTCKCRHCEPCMRAKANKIAHNLRIRLQEKPDGRYRFITLTLAHSQTPLADQIRHLYASFRRLRTSPTWRRTQRGGAATLEVKWNDQKNEWHPHLHIVSEGGYVNKSDLSAAWHTASGGSFIVDVRQLTNEKDAVHYLAKYVTKGTSNNVWNDVDARTEWVTATKGVRSCATYGSWRGFKLTANPTDPGDWKPVATLERILISAEQGNIGALKIVLALRPPGWSEELAPGGKSPGVT